MGGDSAVSSEDGDRTLESPKVFERAGLLLGVSGEMRVAQLLQYVHDVPRVAGGQDPALFVVRDLCGGFRTFMRDNAEELIPERDDDELWQLLVGVRGRLFRVCSHFSASESMTGYDAIGSATPHALGSLASTEGQPARTRVELALRASERHHGGVAAPFTVLEA